MSEQSWREIVREHNEPGSPNILLTLEDAAKEVGDNPDLYDKAFVVLYRKDEVTEKLRSSWFNAAFHFSELIFVFEYLKNEFLDQMRNPGEDE